MRADRDDAPDHLRNPRSKRRKVLTRLGIGSAATWAAIAMFAKPITVDLTALKNAIHMDDQNTSQQTLEQKKAQALARLLAIELDTPPRQAEPKIHAYRPAPPPPAEPQSRQTVFNDRNYTPRTDINTMAAIATVEYNPPPQRRKKPQAIRRGPEPWQWGNYNGSQREYAQGGFYWLEIDGKIDWGSVCMNEPQGSIRYRDYRLGAKVTFARICSRYAPACQAENNFNPAM